MTDTLCWFCKRNCSYGLYENQTDSILFQRTCCWLENGQPIDGWTVTKGYIFRILQSDMSIKKEKSYCVVKCPNFAEGNRFTTYQEYVKMVQKKAKISLKELKERPTQAFKKFEKKTGLTVPIWVWDNIPLQSEHNQQ